MRRHPCISRDASACARVHVQCMCASTWIRAGMCVPVRVCVCIRMRARGCVHVACLRRCVCESSVRVQVVKGCLRMCMCMRVCMCTLVRPACAGVGLCASVPFCCGFFLDPTIADLPSLPPADSPRPPTEHKPLCLPACLCKGLNEDPFRHTR